MSATSRNTWLVPAGSFVIAVLLSLLSGPGRLAAARLPADPTGSDPCHAPTKKDGENDAGGTVDGAKITTEAQGRAGEFGYASDIEWFLRKPSGDVRFFGGAKNGAKGGGDHHHKSNTTMRGWELVKGAKASQCCHPATLDTQINLSVQAHVSVPGPGGTNTSSMWVSVAMDEFADNCAEDRPLKKTITRTLSLTVTRTVDANGKLTDTVKATDSENPGLPNPPIDSAGYATLDVTLKGFEPWFFQKKTQMDYRGIATIVKVQAEKGNNQVAEALTYAFKPSSKYSVADDGTLNECKN
jgi:hypothetical protein